MKTFVVRLFVPAEPVEPEQWPAGTKLCGVVEEISSGRHASFTGDDELLDFLAHAQRDGDTGLSERSTP